MKFLIFLIFLIVERKVEAGGAAQTSPCGTFIPYDPISQPNLPATHGFSAGTFFDDSEVYVGIGTSNCGVDYPARLLIGDKTAPGAYVACERQEIYNASSSKYLENNAGLHWVPIDYSSSPDNIPGSIKTTQSGLIFIARAIITYRGATYVTIVRLKFSFGFVSYDYYNPLPNVDSLSFEILACK